MSLADICADYLARALSPEELRREASEYQAEDPDLYPDGQARAVAEAARLYVERPDAVNERALRQVCSAVRVYHDHCGPDPRPEVEAPKRAAMQEAIARYL